MPWMWSSVATSLASTPQTSLDSVWDGAMSFAVPVTASVLLFRAALWLLSSVRDLIWGRTSVVSRDGPLGVLTWLAQACVVIVPWIYLFRVELDVHLTRQAAYAWVWLAALAWMILRATDTRAAWVRRGDLYIEVQRGLAWWRVHTLKVPLLYAFHDSDGRSPSTLEELKGKRWRARKKVVKAMAAYRGGSDGAERYLARVLGHMGAQVDGTSLH